MEFGVVAQIVLAGLHLFSSERQRYFQNEIKELQDEIDYQSDVEFSKKDQNAKGQAERELKRRKQALADNFAKDLSGVKIG
jgi:hypothetical protein